MDNDELSAGDGSKSESFLALLRYIMLPENQKYFVEEVELKFYYKPRNS